MINNILQNFLNLSIQQSKVPCEQKLKKSLQGILCHKSSNRIRRIILTNIFMYSQQSPGTLNPIILSLFLLSITLVHASNGCIEFSLGTCTRCDSSFHIYQNRCYNNIIGCLRYERGSICVQCDTSFSKLVNGTCDYSSAATSSVIQEKISQVHLYDGKEGERYGESNFRMIPIEQAKNMKTFRSLDNFVRTGEYKHRISRTEEPVFSVYTYQTGESQSFKILYDGTGGAVILCIGDVNKDSFSPTIRSIVVISIHQRIDYCNLYDEAQRCERCIDGYHLENGKCYLSIGGCISYKQNICLKCLDYYLLIENRCVADCPSISDCRTAFYYGISTEKSTIQLLYRTSIYDFSIFQISSGTGFSGSSASGLASISDSNSFSSEMVIKNTTSRSQNQGTGALIMNHVTITTTTNVQTISNQNNVCKKCSPYFYYNKSSKECKEVSPFCKTYSQEDGGCLSCYAGFTSKGKECVF